MFTSEEDEPGRDRVVVLSDELWRTASRRTVHCVGDRSAVGELDPNFAVQDILPATRVMQEGLSNFSMLGWLLASFALLGLLLAALGVYGVMAGFVVQRVPEIGIRIALGAQITDVFRTVMGQDNGWQRLVPRSE